MAYEHSMVWGPETDWKAGQFAKSSGVRPFQSCDRDIVENIIYLYSVRPVPCSSGRVAQCLYCISGVLLR